MYGGVGVADGESTKNAEPLGTLAELLTDEYTNTATAAATAKRAARTASLDAVGEATDSDDMRTS